MDHHRKFPESLIKVFGDFFCFQSLKYPWFKPFSSVTANKLLTNFHSLTTDFIITQTEFFSTVITADKILSEKPAAEQPKAIKPSVTGIITKNVYFVIA